MLRGAEGPPLIIGEFARAFDQSLRDATNGEKRVWSAQTILIGTALRTLIKTAAAKGIISMTGDLFLGTTVSGVVRIGERKIEKSGTAVDGYYFFWVLSLIIEEA